MRSTLVAPLLLLAGWALFLAGAAHAKDPVPAAPAKKAVVLGNAKCPVTGEPVQEGVSVEWEGIEVGLCCPACVGDFQAKPTSFAKVLLLDLAEQLVAAKAKIKDLEARCASKEGPKEREKPVEPSPAPAPSKPDGPKK